MDYQYESRHIQCIYINKILSMDVETYIIQLFVYDHVIGV